jgi:hypothetical protein
MISFASLKALSLPDALRETFGMFDYEKKELLERSEFVRIFRVLNSQLENFGDKSLQESQLEDLVNSVYTMNGKIDGVICYNDFIVTIAEHPIIQMVLCLQFQGTSREKMRVLLSNSDHEVHGSH